MIIPRRKLNTDLRNCLRQISDIRRFLMVGYLGLVSAGPAVFVRRREIYTKFGRETLRTKITRHT